MRVQLTILVSSHIFTESVGSDLELPASQTILSLLSNQHLFLHCYLQDLYIQGASSANSFSSFYQGKVQEISVTLKITLHFVMLEIKAYNNSTLQFIVYNKSVHGMIFILLSFLEENYGILKFFYS